MKYGIDTPKLWSLLTVILIGMIITTCGCKFGKKVNTNSSGISRVITPSDLILQSNGTYKLKPGNPIKPKSAVKSEAVRTKPEPPKIKAADSTPAKNEVKAAGSKTKFSPSVTDVSKTRMNVIKNDKADVKNTVSANEGDSISTNEESKTNTSSEAPQNNSSGIMIKYGELILFYLLGFLIMAFLFIIYDIYKTKKEKKVQPKKKARKRVRKSKPKSS